MRGRFIVFEGIDGSGKSSQAELLKEYLESIGIKVWLTKEPTDGQTGILLQRIQAGEFKEYFKDSVDFARFMTYLYAADRVGHDQQIREHLEAGEWVICDRYKYSTYAYNYNEWISYDVFHDNFLNPDLPILIKIPVEEAINRIDSRVKKAEIKEMKKLLSEAVEDLDSPRKEAFTLMKMPVEDYVFNKPKKREIFETEEFLNKVFDHYDSCEDLYYIDGTGTREEVFERVKKLVDSKVGKYYDTERT